MSYTDFVAHSSHVNCLMFTSDDKYLISGGFNGELKEWNTSDWSNRVIYIGHTKTVNTIALYSDDTELISGGGDGFLKFWDRGEAAHKVTFTDQKKGVNKVFVTPDEKYLLSSSPATMLMIRELPDAKILKSIKAVAKNINILAVSPDSSKAFIGGVGTSLKVYSIPEAKEINDIESHNKATLGMEFFNNGKNAISVGYDGDVNIWDADNWKVLDSIKVGEGGYYGVKMLKDQNYCIVSMPGGLKTINLKETKVIHTAKTDSKGNYAMALSNDGKLLALGSADKRIRLWKTDDLKIG